MMKLVIHLAIDSAIVRRQSDWSNEENKGDKVEVCEHVALLNGLESSTLAKLGIHLLVELVCRRKSVLGPARQLLQTRLTYLCLVLNTSIL